MERELTNRRLPSHDRSDRNRTFGNLRQTRVGGLMLRVTRNDTSSWSTRARTAEGKRTRPKLGIWPAMGISEARKRALAFTVEIHSGGDPVAVRRATKFARKARAALPSVADRLHEWQDAKAPH
jgi:Arm DNA-binding domain